MAHNASPCEVIDRQLIAYNARDIDAYCRLFATDAVLSVVNTGDVVARGIDAIRAHYIVRFQNVKLYSRVKGRIQLGNFVIDHEIVTGISDDPIEVAAIYEVRDELIRAVRLIWP